MAGLLVNVKACLRQHMQVNRTVCLLRRAGPAGGHAAAVVLRSTWQQQQQQGTYRSLWTPWCIIVLHKPIASEIVITSRVEHIETPKAMFIGLHLSVSYVYLDRHLILYYYFFPAVF